MIQNKYDLLPLKNHLKQYPNTKNQALYDICNATTDTQKSAVRVKKGRLLKSKHDTSGGHPDPIETLSSEGLEKRIVDALNKQPDNAQILGKAIEFFIKIKGKSDIIDESFDMEELKRLGLIADVSK